MTRLETLATILPTGYYVDIWSPGDGMTRYRFFQAPEGDPEDRSESYFSGPGLGTEKGYGAAVVFARGLQEGKLATSKSEKAKLWAGYLSRECDCKRGYVKEADANVSVDYGRYTPYCACDIGFIEGNLIASYYNGNDI